LKPRNTAILIFNNVEVLDFTGPYEVFSTANTEYGTKIFNVYTVAEKDEEIKSANGLKIIPDYTLTKSPSPDILIIPGGNGRKIEMNNPVLLNWIKEKFSSLEFLLSVCTGSFILGKTGLLDGAKAATHHYSYEEFKKTFPNIELVKNVKFVDNGKIITAAGVSSGINMSLHMISKLFGEELKHKTARHIEFDS
jgi:transcriptional regulator GlxA family with amidase domain